jgi:hypothetical protein
MGFIFSRKERGLFIWGLTIYIAGGSAEFGGMLEISEESKSFFLKVSLDRFEPNSYISTNKCATRLHMR